MAKAQYIGVNEVAREVTKEYVGVNGVARNVTKGYVGVNGVAREFFNYRKIVPISDYPAGSLLYLPFNGQQTKFMVVHQGNPSSAVYDSSCNGTWLLMHREYTTLAWDSTDNDYANSDVHAYLNSTTLGLFDGDLQPYIKQVKIPYLKGTGMKGTLSTGANGLSTKVFLLSAIEVGTKNRGGDWADDVPADGTVLRYFNTTDSSRLSTGNVWTLRSAALYTDSVFCVSTSGVLRSVSAVTASRHLRPALILDSNTPFDFKTNTLFVD